MVFALLAAAAAMNGMPATDAPSSPNYTSDSVQVASVRNPTYSFPGVGNSESINGRIFKGRVIMGGQEIGAQTPAADAAASYGALGDENLRVQAEVEGLFRFHPTTTVEFSPWTPVPEQQASPYSDSYSRAHQKMSKRAEEARQQWLKDNNYVGGVRTFVNDATLYGVPAAQPSSQLPKPRGVIEVAPEVPAFKSRMHVQIRPEDSPALARIAARTNKVVKVMPKADAKNDTAVVAKTETKQDAKPAIQPVKSDEQPTKVAASK